MMKLQMQRVLCALAILAALPAAASAQQTPTQPAPGAAPPEKIAPLRPEPGPDVAPPAPKPPAVKPSEAPAAPTA